MRYNKEHHSRYAEHGIAISALKIQGTGQIVPNVVPELDKMIDHDHFFWKIDHILFRSMRVTLALCAWVESLRGHVGKLRKIEVVFEWCTYDDDDR
jgi:hypothetical protein